MSGRAERPHDLVALAHGTQIPALSVDVFAASRMPWAPRSWHAPCELLAMPNRRSDKESQGKDENSQSKKPARGDTATAPPRAAADQAIAKQKEALESGEESPT